MSIIPQAGPQLTKHGALEMPCAQTKAPAMCTHIPPSQTPLGTSREALPGAGWHLASPQYVPAPWWPEGLAQSRGSLSCSPHSGRALSKQ